MSARTAAPRRRILFIHQNFPGQFVHVAAELARLGHEVVALGVTPRPVPGVRVVAHKPQKPAHDSALAPLRDFEVKVVRGESAAMAMRALDAEGFVPDTIVAHPAWGEALFCKDVWPAARLLMFSEFFYSAEGADCGFDPEFPREDFAGRMRLRLKNTIHLHSLHAADGGYAPTHWQRSQVPAEYRDKLDVIFDGIDTARVAPDPAAVVQLAKAGVRLRAGDEVVTFVNRNLEPYRGFHVFMRALPELLRLRPNAHVLLVGGDEVSYGSMPKEGGTWRQKLLKEVGAQLPMERVHFLGKLPYADYLRVIQVSACHVYLTYPFVLSWSCVESLSAGSVVVASRTGPVEEVITHGENGLLVDFFDTAALAKQVAEVLADPDAYRGMREKARRTVVDNYDLRTHCLPKLVRLILGD
jgi:glycosyltransferase involved in cell wall biosynthesis